jgi:chromate transport protein ChrA
LAWPWACRALAACIVLDGPSAWGQVGTIAAAGIAGLLWFKPGRGTEQESLAIFAPSFLLVFGALPFWEQLRRHVRTQAVLDGINAAVVGLLLAALYQPV